MLLLVKLQALACSVTKNNTFHGCLSWFLNCTNGTKSRRASHMQKQGPNIIFSFRLDKYCLLREIPHTAENEENQIKRRNT